VADPPLRGIIAAFSQAAAAELVDGGWRKRTGDLFTRDFGNGTAAWLGLNRSTKHRPMRVHPVAGVRHEATMRFWDECSGRVGQRSMSATLSEPVAYLGPTTPDLAVGNLADVQLAVAELRGLVEARALPFAESLRVPDAQLEALRHRRHLAVKEYAIALRPAMLAALGRNGEALEALDEELATLKGRDDAAAAGYRSFGDALRARLTVAGPRNL